MIRFLPDYPNKYQPAGMLHTGSLPEDEKVPGRAKGYMKRTGALWIYPGAGYVVIGLSNLDRDAATRPMIHFTCRMSLR